MNKRLIYGKSDLGYSFALSVAVMVISSLVLSLVMGAVTDPETGSTPDALFWIIQTAYTLCLGSTAFLYAKISKTSWTTATTVNRKPELAHVGWGCLATLFLISVMLPVNEWMLDLIQSLGLPRPSVNMPLQVVPMILVACVLPAFSEELVFRGTVAQSLRGNKNKLLALAVSGALFAVYHVNPAQTLHQFVLGALLTLLAFRSGSVFTSVIVHFFNNLVAVVLTFAVTDESFFTRYGYVFVPVGLVGFALCLFGYVKTTKSNWENYAPVSDDAQSAQQQKTYYEKPSVGALAVAVAVCVALWISKLVVG